MLLANPRGSVESEAIEDLLGPGRLPGALEIVFGFEVLAHVLRIGAGAADPGTWDKNPEQKSGNF